MRGLIAACSLLAGGGIAGGMEWRAVSKDLGQARALHATAYVGWARAPLLDEGARARCLGALLEAMAADEYPAVRHLAWRGARRLMGPGRAGGKGRRRRLRPVREPR